VGSALGAVLLSAGALCLTGCANLGYYWQSASGHMRMLNAAKPVDEWLQDGEAPQRLKDKLALSQKIRVFASRELGLPDNPSYRSYADLRRSAVVWNVVAAPEFSLKLKTWCFPFTGCVSYRGYFDEAEARAEAARVKAEGYEVDVYPVPAYSTLGWMNWAGGDPLLNTFIHYPEGELARLIFHELAHQVVYARDDSMFNESFATAVERLGIQRWLATRADPAVRTEYEAFNARRNEFRRLMRETRRRLEAAYDAKADHSPEARAALKQQVMQGFREDYAQMRERWAVEPARLRAYDAWVARANNATLGAQATYDELVPGFEALFASVGGDWARFYDETRRLAALPKAERHQLLKNKETPGA
jgi:predicted aminopeptidase